jgi:hypothetical protein
MPSFIRVVALRHKGRQIVPIFRFPVKYFITVNNSCLVFVRQATDLPRVYMKDIGRVQDVQSKVRRWRQQDDFCVFLS